MSLYHSRCQSLDLQLIKPGTASTDAECGEEQSSGAGISIVLGVLVVAVISLLVVLILRKKGGCKNTGMIAVYTIKTFMFLIHNIIVFQIIKLLIKVFFIGNVLLQEEKEMQTIPNRYVLYCY